MLTEEDARRLVLAEIDAAQGCVEYDLQFLRVEALPVGWIFYWGAVWDGPNGPRPRLGGNGPFLVDRENEWLIRTATSVPVTRQIAVPFEALLQFRAPVSPQLGEGRIGLRVRRC
ncbi:hypothetical protein [Streptomyces mirabilis]|uniref:hypothetical protein n=1 Tax=Streptomyces mirabilis TaxID=68239 RepID=UPI0031BAA27E